MSQQKIQVRPIPIPESAINELQGPIIDFHSCQKVWNFRMIWVTTEIPLVLPHSFGRVALLVAIDAPLGSGLGFPAARLAPRVPFVTRFLNQVIF